MCASCFDRHHAELQPLNPWTPIRRLVNTTTGSVVSLTIGLAVMGLIRVALGGAIVVPLALAAFVLIVAAPTAPQGLAR